MPEIYRQRIKAVTGNGTGSIKIIPSANKRVHRLQMQMITTGGTNTLAALMTALTEIRVLVGTVPKWRLTGTQLRDFLLLRGTTYDFNGTPNTTGCQVTLPFAPEWFFDVVGDALAWNPALLGAPISVEIDSTSALLLTIVADEYVSDDLSAPSAGILTLEVIKPVVGGTETFVEQPILKPIGSLISASIYPDTGASNEITPVSMMVGPNNRYVWEAVTSAQNDESLERFSLTPAASGRTANIYDLVFVKSDALSQAINLQAWGKAVISVGAASAMSGTSTILLARLEKWWN